MTQHQTPSVETIREYLSLDESSGRLIRVKAENVRVARWVGRPTGSIVDGYRLTRILGHRYSDHRLIFKLIHGYDPPEVDHINRDPLDNRPTNLRAADRAGNAQNTGPRKDCKSGRKGVWLHKPSGKWAAQIIANKSRHFLGQHPTLEEAAD